MDGTLYINGSLVFHSLLLKLNEVLKQIECCLKRNDSINFLNCKITIKEHNKIIKSMEEEFQKFIVEVADTSCKLQNSLQEKAIDYTIQNDSFHFTCQSVLRMIPRLQFSFDDCMNNEKLINKLFMSPEKGRYKNLFTRYKNNKLPERSLVSSSFINCSESNTTNWFTPTTRSPRCKSSSPCHNKKASPRYSKLFSPRYTNRHFAGTCSISSPIKDVAKRLQSKNQTIDLKAMDVKTAIQNIYEFSNRITEIAASLYES
nr:uncharacterized protein LOC117229128 [Megalopta genalis]